MPSLLPRWLIVDEHHLSAGLVRLHDAMRLADRKVRCPRDARVAPIWAMIYLVSAQMYHD
jgi:hypothetical protein